MASRGKWIPAKHLRLLDHKLRDVATGYCPRLIITMPPRHGKSMLVSQYFPPWFLGTFPDKRVMLASYEAGFASSWGRKARDIMEAYGPAVWGIQVREDSKASDRWDLKGHPGGMVTAGVGGPLTGKGADVLIIDDPIKNAEEASSKVIREKAWEWYQSTAYTRLEPGGAVILIQTRWHKDDLAGRLLSQKARGGEKWDVLNLPAIAPEGDILGRVPGAPLWPERFDLPRLRAIKDTVGTYFWMAMYQQSPTEPGGNILKREWFTYYRDVPELHFIVQSWDCAFKSGKASDYSACTTWGQTPGGYCLLDVWRGRVEYPDLIRMARAQYDKHRPHAVIIEDAGSGQSLLQDLRRESIIPALPIKATKDKETRVNVISPLFESGRVHFPERHELLADLQEELLNFPNAEHDDMVDSISQALAYLKDGESVSSGCSDVLLCNDTGLDDLFENRRWREIF
ncbi:MAG: phage terminase large subunit [Methanomassiliicoccus sp.]|nr:phage terminase large subunit [Methanomassiliicoccus sp.]